MVSLGGRIKQIVPGHGWQAEGLPFAWHSIDFARHNKEKLCMTHYSSDPRHHTGPECQSMQDVRYEIDRLDRVLVGLLKERQDYMDAAARLKPFRTDVRDEARIEDVVSKVLQSAAQQGLDPQIAEPVWRTMIERCIAYELSRFDEDRKA